jgi:hypothetical protein
MARSARSKGLKDKAYLAFIASLPCLITGERPVTVHHVRFCGSPRNDHRTVPLVARLHMRTHEKPGFPCIERGKKVFEALWRVDLEAAIKTYNRVFESEKAA